MTSFTSWISSIKSAYNNLNPSTLTGAIDIIVVKQEDGTLRCTPFHVRFGKLGVLQNQQNKVYITINGNPVEDLYMELGVAGEAVFIEEDTSTPCLPPTRHLEPSDSSLFLDPDNALSIDSHPQLSNIDCSPQIINKQLDEQKSHETNEPIAKYAYEQPLVPSLNVDVLNSNTSISNRRRPKRRSINRTEQINKQSSEDEDQEIEKMVSPVKHRSRARQRDLTPVSMDDNPTSRHIDERVESSSSYPRRRSASENDLPFFQIDGEDLSESSTPFVDAHSRINSIDSRKKLLIIPPKISVRFDDDDADESYTSSQEDSINDDDLQQKTTRTLSNPIPIEQKPIQNDLLEPNNQLNPLINTIFSQSAPLTNNINTVPIRISQSNDPTAYYLNEDFSPASSFENTQSHRPTSPKSDTEYELDKPSEQSIKNNRTSIGWRWRWGELPEQGNFFRYLWPSSAKQSTPKEGLYLDEVTNNKCDDRSLYLPQMDYHQNQQRNVTDDDQESGTGNSIPNSPIREHETSCLLGDVQLSLCGNVNKPSPITDDIFNAHLISFEKFANNPTIINDPNLVVRIAGKFYNWNVASALIASTSIYHKELPPEIIENLQEKHMTPTKSRTSSSSWWPFSGRKSDITNENTKLAAAEALALVAKSKVVPTLLKNANLIRNNSNDSELEDNEVRKLTDKMEQPKPSVHTSSLKKTMILTSDQLKRLNLKSGVNQVEFSVTTSLQGTSVAEANIFFFDHMTKFVISDIDGTITKSDVFGHILPLVGKDWSHDGIAEFFQAIQENGYQFIYLSARAIGQSQITRNFLRNIKQCGRAIPNGPLLISPDTLVTALYREVIAKRPEDFKIECLKNIASLFPGKNPFYAGFGNRINDQWAYTAVGIPVTRIFTINPRGEVVRQKISQVLSTSYKNLHEVVDHVFPPMDSFSASESYSSFTFWRDEPSIASIEDEMREHLEEMSKRQKTKGKAPSTPTASASTKTTPMTTVIKPGGEKLLTLAQATENTVKKP